MSLPESWWKERDVRVDDWALMSSPWPITIMCGLYIYGSTVLGPKIMEKRSPFQLQQAMIAYNLIQVVLSGYIAIECGASGWFTGYNWLCQNVDRDDRPGSKGQRMAAVTYLYFLMKFVDMADTVFMIARKKLDQVSALHVYHHSVLPIHTWIIVRFLPGGHETLGIMINSFVHVVMYSYYLLAALGPHMQKYLWWKKYLTTIQIVQFVVLLIHSCLVAFNIVQCGYDRNFSISFGILMVSLLVLFCNFYRQSYSKPKIKTRHVQ